MRIAALALALTACGMDGADGTDIGPMTNGVSTLAGNAQAAYVDGARELSRFDDPVNTAIGPDGKVYVADFNNSKIRVVDSAGNTSTLIAQNDFRRPFGMAFEGNTLYVSTDNDQDGGHSLTSGSLWRIDIGAKSATVLANAIGRPRGFYPLKDGRIAITDDLHHMVEIYEPSSNKLTVLAGTKDQAGDVDATGAAARFNTPYSVVQRANGDLVIADFGNNKIRVVTLAGEVSTLAGGSAGFADGGMSDAQFDHPQALAIDSNDVVYVTDLGNYRIRRITDDTVETIAGNGQGGWQDADNPLDAELYGLEGMSVDAGGTMLYVADGTRGETVPHNFVRTVKVAP